MIFNFCVVCLFLAKKRFVDIRTSGRNIEELRYWSLKMFPPLPIFSCTNSKYNIKKKITFRFFRPFRWTERSWNIQVSVICIPAALVPKKLIMATMMFLLQYPNISADIIRDLDICEPDVLSNKRWITCKTWSTLDFWRAYCACISVSFKHTYFCLFPV